MLHNGWSVHVGKLYQKEVGLMVTVYGSANLRALNKPISDRGGF